MSTICMFGKANDTFMEAYCKGRILKFLKKNSLPHKTFCYGVTAIGCSCRAVDEKNTGIHTTTIAYKNEVIVFLDPNYLLLEMIDMTNYHDECTGGISFIERFAMAENRDNPDLPAKIEETINKIKTVIFDEVYEITSEKHLRFQTFRQEKHENFGRLVFI